MNPTTTSRSRDLLTIALWAGVGAGFIEGALHLVLRNYPALQAAHKLGPDALWITPVGNLPIVLGLALVLAVLARRWPALAAPPLAWGIFAAVGNAAVLRAPEVLHPATVILLSLGVGTMAFRLARARGADGLPALRRWLPALPVAILLAAGATALAARLGERSRVAALPPVPEGRPDVLILMLDTIRRDRFTGATSLTPFLDSLAAEGATYENAWAPSSWSLPAQASILTGRHANVHGANWPTLELNDSIPTLAEAFRDAGYATGAFSSNHSWITPEYLGRGFTRFRVYQHLDLWERTTAGRAVARVLTLLGRRAGAPVLPAAENAANYLEFVDTHPGRPVFGYLCFMDVNRAFYNRLLGHPAWRPKNSMTSAVAAYDSALVALDSELRGLLGELRRRGRLENTVIVVTSDHGESFGATETEDHDPKGHGSSLYPEQVRVPFFVVAPGRVPAGLSLPGATTLVDIPGLVLGLAGVPDARFAPGAALEALRSPATADSVGSVFATLDYDRWSARTAVRGSLQYLVTLTGPKPVAELFDLATDSLARQNLPQSDPRRGELRALLEYYDRGSVPAATDRDPGRR